MSQALPTRTNTFSNSDDEAVPNEDASEVTKLFQERLQAYKHACGYLEDYVKAVEKDQASRAKDMDKVLKTVSSQLKESHHFSQEAGGIAGLFDNIRGNTQGLANSSTETSKTLKGQVLPTFERLHTEIKHKNKELTKGAGKSSKAVDKARALTQKHIELLGSNAATFDSAGGNVAADKDPYILKRGINHRLNSQITHENNNRNDMLELQNSFSRFEAHITQTLQQGLSIFIQTMGTQSEKEKALYSDMLATSQRIQPDFEWQGFLRRSNDVLIDPSAPPRSVGNVSFPNQNHAATQPLIAGALERKGKLMKFKANTGFYVITPSKYLHEFETDDDFQKDPTPENSLYLPDCSVGHLEGQRFTIKGKDSSKGMLGTKGMMSHEFQFKAHTSEDAARWYAIISKAAGQVTNEVPGLSEPNSPVVNQNEYAGSGFSGTTVGGAPAADTRAGEAADLGHTTGTTGVVGQPQPTTGLPQTTGGSLEHPADTTGERI